MTERTVEALERIAAALERLAPPEPPKKRYVRFYNPVTMKTYTKEVDE